jgi:hypothetical protein
MGRFIMMDSDPIDHDANFKRLLTTFFHEFVTLFLPEVSAYLDPNTHVEFLDKEIFTDITAGERREVDLIAKVRFRGQEAFFLIHIENQTSARSNFPGRMFRYFARLHEKYNLPVYPVALFSYDAPQRPEPNQYQVAFPDTTVLQFSYRVIQLNRLSWRRFVTQPNPVAAALMVKMKIAPKDRPKVKLECLRLLATLKLDPARSRLIGAFIDTYLNLTADEMKRYERAFARLTPEEKEATMDMVSRWEEKVIQKGMEHVVLRLLRRRVGDLPAEIERHIHGLTPDQIDALTDTLLDIQSVDQVAAWLTRQMSQRS